MSELKNLVILTSAPTTHKYIWIYKFMCNKFQPLTPFSTFPCKLILFDALLLSRLLHIFFSNRTENSTDLFPEGKYSTEGSGEVDHLDSD